MVGQPFVFVFSRPLIALFPVIGMGPLTRKDSPEKITLKFQMNLKN